MNRYDFPKTDLHCHLDGAILPATLFALARERGVELPAGADSAETLAPFVVYGPDCTSVNAYLKKFELPTRILQDAEALDRCACELTVRLAAQGLAYADIRFAPQLHTEKGLSQAGAIEAVRRGIDRGLAETAGRIRIGLIACCMCVGAADLNRAANLETAKLAVEYHDKGLLQAMDLAGAEGFCPLLDFAELFDIARAGGVPYTCHAGDSQPPEEIRTAIERFGARRIGHGHHISRDPELCREAIDLGVTLEVCPTSNVQCETEPSYAEHPIKQLYDMGMRIAVCTDNPVIAGVTVEDEYDNLEKHLGFARRDLVQMNVYAAEAAFLPEEEKAALAAQIRAYL